MKLEMVCIQLCQGAVSAWCTDKPCIVDSVPDHMVVVAYQEHVNIYTCGCIGTLAFVQCRCVNDAYQ